MAVDTSQQSRRAGQGAPRVQIEERTLRRDRWWGPPLVSFLVLSAFVVYATVAAFLNRDYYVGPHAPGGARDYISPFYSPCIAHVCGQVPGSRGVPHLSWFGPWWALSPALLILIFPLGFRLTCYYYRKAYYRAFWQSPPACAVAEPHKRYTGETRFPLILQNIHRYFWYAGLVFNVILTYDAIVAFKMGNSIGLGVGTLVLLVNASLLWLYSLSCHSCRHIVGGRLNNFSKHPTRYKFWTFVSRLNGRHMQYAWVSLIWVALSDLYVRLVASGAFHDPRFF